MKVCMSPEESDKLAKFLERKYAKRVDEEGHGYTMGEFAKELDMARSTVSRLMSETTKVKAIHLRNLRKLIKKYKQELIDELDLKP